MIVQVTGFPILSTATRIFIFYRPVLETLTNTGSRKEGSVLSEARVVRNYLKVKVEDSSTADLKCRYSRNKMAATIDLKI